MRRGLTASPAGVRRAVVGAVSQLYQGDWDFGRHVLERLERERLEWETAGAAVALEQFDYGAVAVVQRLEELAPELLILVGAAERRRPPGVLTRREVTPTALPRGVVRQAVAEAVTGYVTIELLLEVAGGLGALPARTVVIELQPVTGGPSVELSPAAAAAVERAAGLVRDELARSQPSGSSAASSTPSA